MAIDYSGVISRLKELKSRRGLTNDALAERSGVPLGTVNKLFAGSIGSIKLGTLISLADALGGQLADIISAATKERPPMVMQDIDDNFGYVRVGVATPPIQVADVKFNAEGIISAAENAASKGVKILVLPELSLTGYTCGDLFYQAALLDSAEKYIGYIAQCTAGLKLVLFFGAPIRKDGRIYNCAVAACEGEILGVVPKSYLPNYNEFYDKRQFNPAPRGNSTVNICGREYPFGTDYIFKNTLMPSMKIGCEICEDLWVAKPPSSELALAGATIIANLSCSDEKVGKAEFRRSMISIQSAKTYTAYLYANAGDGESTTDMVFSGHSMICDNGTILKETELFKNGAIYTEVDLDLIEFDRSKFFNQVNGEMKAETIEFSLEIPPADLTRKYAKTPFLPPAGEMNARAELVLNMQAQALKRRLSHIRCMNVVLGVSGGLDSTLALLVCARTFDLLGWDRSGIHAVTMPCFGTTTRTFNNAVSLAELLGCTLVCVDIKDSVTQHFEDIGHDINVTDTTYENAQARERTQVLMDLANKYNGIVVGTGDLSELALGWATYNGDHMSMYAVNASIPKTLVRVLVEHEANTYKGELKSVLQDILDTPVSPELLPNENDRITQVTENSVGPYVLHDFFLYHMLRHGFKPSKIYALALRTFEGDFGEETIYKWLSTFIRRFFSQQFKRSCMPDGPKIGSVTLSPRGDWRMPSDATCRMWIDDLEKIRRKR